MGFRELTDSQFGKRVREERERRGWSQEDLAKRLTDRGIPVYPSTIAKIESEKKPRAARLGEAAGIADLFELSVDELLGRQGPDDSTLTFALTVLGGYASDAERQILRAREVAANIEDQLESVEESFDFPHMKTLQEAARNMAGHLDAAHAKARELSTSTTDAIVEAPETTAGEKRDPH